MCSTALGVQQTRAFAYYAKSHIFLALLRWLLEWFLLTSIKEFSVLIEMALSYTLGNQLQMAPDHTLSLDVLLSSFPSRLCDTVS